MIDVLTLEKFEAHVGETFRTKLAGGRVLDFILESASPLTDRAVAAGAGDADRRAPFSLVFLGPEGIALPQATYLLAHEALGRLDIFVVPVEQTGNRLLYEAIFT